MSRITKLAARAGALLAAGGIGALVALSVHSAPQPPAGQVPASWHAEFGNELRCQWQGNGPAGQRVQHSYVCQ